MTVQRRYTLWSGLETLQSLTITRTSPSPIFQNTSNQQFNLRECTSSRNNESSLLVDRLLDDEKMRKKLRRTSYKHRNCRFRLFRIVYFSLSCFRFFDCQDTLLLFIRCFPFYYYPLIRLIAAIHLVNFTAKPHSSSICTPHEFYMINECPTFGKNVHIRMLSFNIILSHL